ncbi:TPA: colicin-Ia domain protein [Escherichia coli]|nr:colicin-Ia domain protein [Escherichia coli]
MLSHLHTLNQCKESIEYDSDSHQIIDIYVMPPNIDIFSDIPPSWSSFWNKNTQYENDLIINQSFIEKRNKEITEYKDTLRVKLKENEKKITKSRKLLTEAIDAKEEIVKHLEKLNTINLTSADTLQQDFRLSLAALKEYGFRIEIAGYDAIRLHIQSRMLFADADSFCISLKEAWLLIKQAESLQKDAQNTDKKTADMLSEYERRRDIMNTQLFELRSIKNISI